MSSLTTGGDPATGTALRQRPLVSRPLTDHGAVIDLIDRAPDGHAALAALIAGLEYDCLWRYQRIVEPVQDAKRIAVENHWPDLLMRLSVLEADISRRRGDIVRAATDMHRVNRWAAEHGDDFVLAQTQLEIASIFRSIGDDAQCLAHAIQALAHTTESTPIWARVNYLSLTAIALEANKSNVEAYERFDEALELAEADGDADLVVMVLNNMSYCMYMRGENEACIEYADRMREVIAGCAVDLPAHCLDTLARVEMIQGRNDEAERILQPVLDDPEGGLLTEADALPVCLLTLAEAQRLRGELDEAESTLTWASLVADARGLDQTRTLAREELAHLFAARGDYERAYEELREFHADWIKLHDSEREVRARVVHALYEIEQARRARDRFRELAAHDPLTGLHNRRYLNEELPIAIARTVESNPLSVALLDLDFFKRVNDTLSHETGDLVLQQVAALISSHRPSSGSAVRMGGEEFLVIMPDTDESSALARCERLRRAIANHPWSKITSGIPVTVSIGIATIHDGATTMSALLSVADRNLYAAKHAGRNRIVGTAP